MPRKQLPKWSNEELVTKMHEAKAFTQPIVQEFLDRAEYNLFEKWKTTTEQAVRDEVWLQGQGIAAFRKFIEETIILGKMAEAELTKKLQDEQKRKGQ